MFSHIKELFTRPSGYKISRSVRLRSSASAYLSRTLGTPTSGTTWTWSGWVKRGSLGGTQGLQHAYSATNNQGGIYFGSDTLTILDYPTSTNCNLTTTQVFRDPSAWYHIVVAVDTTQATSSNRVKMYVNGVQITAFGTATYPTQNTTFRMVASGNSGSVGRYYDGTSYYFDGYLTEINFIDGQALTPSSFGETDTTTGVWKPKKYAGTYGTNGFYLNFSDNSNNTAATIGKDSSGNGNNWTPNAISVTAGVTYDSMLDVPTLWADGGNGRGNYCTLNPLDKGTVSVVDGNLSCVYTSADNFARATMQIPAGQWYWEATISGGGSPYSSSIGIAKSSDSGYLGSTANAYAYVYNATKRNNASAVSYGATWTLGDVIGVAFDASAGTLTFYKNGVSQGSAYTGLTSLDFFPSFGTNGGTWAVNFGQRPFTYTPPTGFIALNTQNLPTPTISNGANYMAATTYTGTGSALTIANTVNGISFQPDFVWVKGRSGATDHALYDSVRGTTKDLASNSAAAETTQATGLTAFGSTGFTVGALAKMNTNAATYVGWQWNGGGSTVTNTSGSISSQVRANTTAGFSVVTYTGTGANATVGHGLGVAPKMIIAKNRTSGVTNWAVYHSNLTSASYYLWLDDPQAQAASVIVWNNTAPTSTVFSVGTGTQTNGSTTMVAYCFSEVAGYSQFGGYTGNGSADGPFVFCGFRPRFVMFKRTDTTSNWYIFDTGRDTYNVMPDFLNPNAANAETSVVGIDFLSNGFKQRGTAADYNASGGTYIFAAFAENPTKFALAR